MTLPLDLHVVFETNGEGDVANAVVLREMDESDEQYFWRVKIFFMACAIGLFELGVEKY